MFLAVAALAAPLAASAQWQWIDSTGRRVFSDQPPPADVPAKNILKQPGGRAAPPSITVIEPGASAPAAAPAKVAASAPKVTGKDPALEEKRKQLEAAEAEKKKAEEEKLAQARSENCTRAKQHKANMESGVRVAMADAKGERRYLDDAEKAAEVKRANEIIARDCK
jgi:phage tail sheath protein FI